MLRKDQTHCCAEPPADFARVSNDLVAVPRIEAKCRIQKVES